MRDSYIFYASFYEAIKELNSDDRLTVYDAINEYSLTGAMPKLTGIPKAMMTLIKPQIDANNRRFENGQRGGRPKKDDPTENLNQTKPEPNPNQTQTKPEPNVNDNVNDNVNVNVGGVGGIDGGEAALPSPSEILEVEVLDPEINESTIPKLEPEKAPPIAAAPPANEDEPKDPPPKTPKTLAERVQGVVDYFNKTCTALPKVKELTDPRKKAIVARLGKYGSDQVKEVIDKTAASEFLNGANDQGWKASFDWIIKPANFTKIRENTYDNAQPTNTKTSRTAVPSTSDGYSTDLPD